mmetsp:Transcript_8294/g.26080  ORF Transcript_8294/g.26080 Transcript_8294/m.26080 type:complete len:235 (+) Transcript_8294:478-1182(+)
MGELPSRAFLGQTAVGSSAKRRRAALAASRRRPNNRNSVTAKPFRRRRSTKAPERDMALPSPKITERRQLRQVPWGLHSAATRHRAAVAKSPTSSCSGQFVRPWSGPGTGTRKCTGRPLHNGGRLDLESRWDGQVGECLPLAPALLESRASEGSRRPQACQARRRAVTLEVNSEAWPRLTRKTLQPAREAARTNSSSVLSLMPSGQPRTQTARWTSGFPGAALSASGGSSGSGL